MKDDLVKLIIENIRQLDGQQELQIPADLDGQTALFGRNGILDSMALVTLVVAVEQAIEDKFRASVSLADARAMSQQHSPYRTVDSLAEYAAGLVAEAK